MKKNIFKLIFMVLFLGIAEKNHAQIITRNLDLDLSSSGFDITAYPDSDAYPGHYEVNMRVTASVNTHEYGRFYLYPRRRKKKADGSWGSWGSFVPNVTGFPNTGYSGTPSSVYSGTAKVLQYQGTEYQYKVKIVFKPVDGGSKTVYTPTRTAKVIGVPKPCFTMYNIKDTHNENSKYGSKEVKTICKNAVAINGSCSQFEKGYHIRIAEFDLSSWTIGTNYYNDWVGSGTAPSYISLNALINENGYSFQIGKLYMVSLSIGPVWKTAPLQFFRVQECFPGSPNGIIENIGQEIVPKELEESVNFGADNDSDVLDGLKLYPNPVGNQFTVSNEKSNTTIPTSIRIVDSKGNEVLNKTYSQTEFKVATSSWKSGVYFCEIKVGEKLIKKKILKK
ncbi:T9SS type A sorting domain-containing protein [Tenacibaculum xiamenense]|uniref:T9SS type A sorting domain-containing protein n=1 Tax=Tenacibaculum xiamenense TaxID=1261553 RepID=UPI00389371F5